jgi:hypothetical protein
MLKVYYDAEVRKHALEIKEMDKKAKKLIKDAEKKN